MSDQTETPHVDVAQVETPQVKTRRGLAEPGQRGDVITHVTHRAMATEFVVMLPTKMAGKVEQVVEALEMLDPIEAALTIYQPHSEISRLNRDGHDRPVKLSASTFALLGRSILWSERTGGAFDVTAGPLVDAWGFNRRSGRKPTAAEIDAARASVGYKKLILDADERTVRFSAPGMAINLGAIGKGEALDRLAGHLKAAGVTDFLIHGGNSSVIAAGDQTAGTQTGWAVGLAHPTKPRRRMAGLWLKDMALATSGSGKQFFHHKGRRYGHVIDPRTGQPAGDLQSISVLMPSATDADAAATGLFVMGRSQIEAIVSAEKSNQNKSAQNKSAQNETLADWTLSPMILVAAGPRQDEVDVRVLGEIDWIDPPSEAS